MLEGLEELQIAGQHVSFDVVSVQTLTDEDNYSENIPPFIFPETLEQWVSLDDTDHFDMPWEFLRGFFESCGYELYVCPPRNREDRNTCVPSAAEPLRLNKFGTIGDSIYIPEYDGASNRQWAAEHREGRHVIIRVYENNCEDTLDPEVEIMDYLIGQYDQIMGAKDMAIPLTPIDRITYCNWLFLVFPLWQNVLASTPTNELRCPLPDQSDILRFCKEVCKGFAFLHEHHIAHLCITPWIFQMNVRSGTFLVNNWYKSTHLLYDLPVRFAITGFQEASQFDEDNQLAEAVPKGRTRPQMPPEVWRHDRQPYDPYTSDVYQLGILLTSFFREMTDDIPEMGLIFEKMTRFEYQHRISMNEAAVMFEDIIQIYVFRPLRLEATFNIQPMDVFERPEEEDVEDTEKMSDSGSDSEGAI
ncbi:hypothetical protein K474DRAFT_1672611 [Panus rudis PR-1116 ss-1]|nr:hypothetical protein K474DRAFT_1672611 [Panus rudis PR-1116 ss-1]